MGDIHETGYNLPITNFTDDNPLSNGPTQYYDFSRNVNRSRKRRREFNFLNKTINQYSNLNPPVVDLTTNNGQSVNRRIPVIDLTEDDVKDITDQIQCIDLTNCDSSSNIPPNRHFELKRKMVSSSNTHHVELKRKLDSPSTSRPACQLELPSNDFLSTSHFNRQLDQTRNSNFLNSSPLDHPIELTRNCNSSNDSHIDHFATTRNGDSSHNSHQDNHFNRAGSSDPSHNSQQDNHFNLAESSDPSHNSQHDNHFNLAGNSNPSCISHQDNHFMLPRNGDSSNNSQQDNNFMLITNDDSSNNGQQDNHFMFAPNPDSSNNSHQDNHFMLTENGDSSNNGQQDNHCILTTNADSSNKNHQDNHFMLTANTDSSNNGQEDNRFMLTTNGDSSNNSQQDDHFVLTTNGDSSNNSQQDNHCMLTRNGDFSNYSHKDNHCMLTRNGNSLNNNHLEHKFGHTDNGDSLSKENLNHQLERTRNDVSLHNSHPKQQYELSKNGMDINHSSGHFSAAGHDGQNLIPNILPSPLISDDKFTNFTLPYMTYNNEQNNTHKLQNTGLNHIKQQRSVKKCQPAPTFTYDIGQSIDQTIPPINLNFSGHYENYRQPIFGIPPVNNVQTAESLNLTDKLTKSSGTIQNDTFVREPIDIAGMYETEVRSCNYFPTNCSKFVPGIYPIIPFERSRYAVTAFNFLKCNEASNMNFLQIKTSSSLKHQCRNQVISKISHPLTNIYHQKDLAPTKYAKASRNNTPDFLKPATHPILFRRSLGRSTVNTSKHTPIESPEAEKAGTKTTVASTVRRRKTKSTGAVPKQDISNSYEPVSRARSLSFGAVKEFFLKFIFLFVFIWIVYVFLWYLTG